MKVKLHLLLWSLALVLVSACSDDDKPKIPEPPAIGEERTVLVYWVGDNNLSNYALNDFNEMVEGAVGIDATKNNLVVYSDVRNAAPQLIHISKQSGVVVADTVYTYEEQNSLKKDVMSGIMSKVITEFPAKSYGLVFASHADGWMEATKSSNTRHIGDYRGYQMDITDFREVLEGIHAKEGIDPLEFILFDACYMQAIEVAYELRNVTKYVVGSPTEIPAPGAPYQKVVPFMFSSSAAIDIANAYYSYYGNTDGTIRADAEYINEYGELKLWTGGVSVSVLKTSELDDLAAATADVLADYAGNKTSTNTYSLFDYGYSEGKGGYARYYDLDQLIEYVTGEYTGDYEHWRPFFDKAQPYFKTTDKCYANRKNGSFSMDGASGVSTCVLHTNVGFLDFYRTLQWYTDGNVWQSSGW